MPRRRRSSRGPPATRGPRRAIWNPDAAANWCLLFSPVFGTWLHMKNWRALGEPERARNRPPVVIAALALIIVAFLLPVGAHLRGEQPIRWCSVCA